MSDIMNLEYDIPVVKTFINNGHYYLYDTYNNHLLEISKEHYVEIGELLHYGLSNYIKNKKETNSYEDILMLINRGYLRTPWINNIEHPENKVANNIINRGMQHLTLQVTQDCNFKCRYCHYTKNTDFERNHSKNSMSWDVAKKSIDFFWEHSKDSFKISFGFYGGEPLLNFALIRKCVEYIEAKFETRSIAYNITTNGSILCDEIIGFLADKKFIVSVSLDGPPYIQNYNRKYYSNGKDTFDTVWKNVERMKFLYPDWFCENVYFHPVYLAHENISDIIRFFNSNAIETNKVLLTSANLDGIDYFFSNINTQITEEKSEQIMKNRSRSDFDKQFNDEKVIPTVWHHNGPCVPGGRKIFVDLEGNVFPCEKLNSSISNSIGDIYNGINSEIAKKIMNIGKMNESECKECFAMRFCDICIQNCYNPEKRCIDLSQKQLHCDRIKKRTIKYLKQYATEREGDII